MANPFLGVFLHAVGGFAAGSFYIPYKKVRGWAWETYWLVGGAFSWILVPWIVALLTADDVIGILREAPTGSLIWSYVFGLLWGIGGLTFGLTMRYLGLSLGMALALGFCAAFGTVIPPVFQGKIVAIARSLSGQVTLGGVVVCLAGIAVCGLAGVAKERELTTEAKQASIEEFNFVKGVWVAVFAGIMSACMAFAIAAGKPIAELAVARGVPALWQNTPVFVVILAGGFTTNFIWCTILNMRNRTADDYVNGKGGSLAANYFFSALAGTTWYMQFMFYGMGTTQMGAYDFSSWTIHMAFIIVFSNLWGLAFREWRGTSGKTHNKIFTGILVLIFSTVVVGFGNYLGQEDTTEEAQPSTQPASQPSEAASADIDDGKAREVVHRMQAEVPPVPAGVERPGLPLFVVRFRQPDDLMDAHPRAVEARAILRGAEQLPVLLDDPPRRS